MMSRLIVSIVVLASSTLAKPLHAYPMIGRGVREDLRLDSLLARDSRIDVVASGFDWAEGPAWDEAAREFVFSDIPRNSISRWTPQSGAALWTKPSGFTGVGDYSPEPGRNGLGLDSRGRLTDRVDTSPGVRAFVQSSPAASPEPLRSRSSSALR